MSWAEVAYLNKNLLNVSYKVFTENGTFEVPKGVYILFVTMYDGGGSGGAGGNAKGGDGGGQYGGAGGYRESGSGYKANGGGGGGFVVNLPIEVTPFEILNVVVGKGGESVTVTSEEPVVNGNDGGSSYIYRDGVIIAQTTHAGGAGGLGSYSGTTSDDNSSLVSGTVSDAYCGTGGGGGAGYFNRGLAGIISVGELSLGGSGGNGAAQGHGGVYAKGFNGVAYGGGGGGGGSTSGAGAPGIVAISCNSPMINQRMLLFC